MNSNNRGGSYGGFGDGSSGNRDGTYENGDHENSDYIASYITGHDDGGSRSRGYGVAGHGGHTPLPQTTDNLLLFSIQPNDVSRMMNSTVYPNENTPNARSHELFIPSNPSQFDHGMMATPSYSQAQLMYQETVASHYWHTAGNGPIQPYTPTSILAVNTAPAQFAPGPLLGFVYLSPDLEKFSYMCRLCGLGFGRHQEFSRHVGHKHTNKRVKCPHCDKLFPARNDYLNQHIANVHPGHATV